MLEDRARIGRLLTLIGTLGLVASLAVGLLGWVVAGRLTTSAMRISTPMTTIANDVVVALDASVELVQQTTEAITSIENATRSTGRTIESVTEALMQVRELASEEVATSLDAAVDTLPALIDTAGVIDATMRALSFFGVDYDPNEPLDDSLAGLMTTLEPIPDQIRDQSELLGAVETDLTSIGDDAGELAAILLETRISMTEVERIVGDAAQHAADAVVDVESVRSEVEGLGATFRLLALGAAVAVALAGLTPLLIGTHFRRTSGSFNE